METLLNEISSAVTLIEEFKKEDCNSLNFTPLRKLSKICQDILVGEKANDESAIAFFLYTYITNIIVNFGGDTIYDDKLLASKTVIYQSLIKWLRELKESLIRKDLTNVFEIINSMVKEYYKQVNILNSEYK
jgi:hypothetical protein